MKIYSYDEIYLENAKTTLATLFDYAVNFKHIDIDDFAILFLKSNISNLFSIGTKILLLASQELTYIMKLLGMTKTF